MGYEALMSVTKASFAFSDLYNTKTSTLQSVNNPSEKKFVIYIGIPVIVVDAPLYYCYLDNQGKLIINPCNELLVEWYHPHVGGLMIRVIRIEELPILISKFHLSLESLSKSLIIEGMGA